MTMMTRLGFAWAAAMNAPELQSAKVVPSERTISILMPRPPCHQSLRSRSICLWTYLAMISERSPDGESKSDASFFLAAVPVAVSHGFLRVSPCLRLFLFNRGAPAFIELPRFENWLRVHLIESEKEVGRQCS